MRACRSEASSAARRGSSGAAARRGGESELGPESAARPSLSWKWWKTLSPTRDCSAAPVNLAVDAAALAGSLEARMGFGSGAPPGSATTGWSRCQRSAMASGLRYSSTWFISGSRAAGLRPSNSALAL